MRRALLWSLPLLMLVACRDERPAAGSEAPRDTLEVRVDMPGVEAESIERMLAEPLEDELGTLAGIASMTTEAAEGRVRLELELEPGSSADVVLRDVQSRLERVQEMLSSDAEPPVLYRHRNPRPATLHFSVSEDAGDAARSLIAGIEATPGVGAVARCQRSNAVVIELDPRLLDRTQVDPFDVEMGVRAALRELTTLDDLRMLWIAYAGREYRLWELASLRIEPVGDGCRAYSDRGPSVAFSVEAPDSETRVRVEELLQDASEAGLELQRFDARVHLWLSDPERTLALLHEAVEPPWLLELDVEAAPCAGPGVLAHLHLERGRATAALVDDLGRIPGVAFAELPWDPALRIWLPGQDLDRLRALAHERSEALASDPDIAAFAWIDDEPDPELAIRFDRDKLAALGLSVSTAEHTLELGLDGVELGQLHDGDSQTPVRLRVGADSHDLTSLTLARVDGQAIPLGAVAELQATQSPARICRRDRERGMVLLVRPRDAAARASVVLRLRDYIQ